MDLQKLQRDVTLLKLVVLFLLLSLAVTWTLAFFSFRKKVKFNTIEASNIQILDQNGIARVVIAAQLPNPRVKGKEYPRSTKVAGIQLNDLAGNEMGGLGVADEVGGVILCFDYGTAEAICLTKLEKANYTGLVMLDKPLPGSEVGKTGSQRLLFALENGESKLVLNDKDGKERIKLSVDSSNKPTVQVLDDSGRAVFTIPAR